MQKLFFFIFSVLLIASCDKTPVETTERFQEIESKSQFDNIISNGVSLMMFHSPSCSICNAQKPLVDATANDEELKAAQFYLVDVNKHKEITAAHKINGFPVIVIFKDNKEVERLLGGGHSTEKLKNLVKTHL